MQDTPFSNLMTTRIKLREPSKHRVTPEDLRELSKSALPRNIDVALYSRFVEGE
jgi:hypothetical protein